MSAFPKIHPGYGLQVQSIVPASTSVGITASKKPVVFLTSVKIPDEHIWANGLFQNVYVIYKMLEILGYEPWIMVDNNENHKTAKIHDQFRMSDFKTYITNPYPITCYIEMGMSCDPGLRRFLRTMGTKIIKLYLGNIFNIDVETITFTNNVNFSHHVAGEIDEIWVSPHYDINADYAGSINAMCGKTRIAPYVWDSHFIKDLGYVYNGTSFTRDSPRTFVVMEPNISFQKCSLIPIMALEAYYRKYPERVETAVIVNGQKFAENRYFQTSIAPNLTILRDGKLKLMPRAHIINLAKAYPHAIIVQHQVNNEYNYSLLEWITMGFPVIHNVSRFKTFGYYYDKNDFDGAASMIETIVESHETNKEVYTAHTRQLVWQFSIYNPANLDSWRKLLELDEKI